MAARDFMAEAQKFVTLTRRKRALQADLTKLDEELAPLQASLLDAMENDRFPNQARVDGATIHIKRRVTVSPKDGNYDAACDALEASDLADYAQRRFNAQSMAAFVKEQQDLGQPLPPALEAALNVGEVFTLGLRAA